MSYMTDIVARLYRTINGYSSLGGSVALQGVSTPGSNYFLFDGTDDYIEFNSGNMFTSADPLSWTVSMWIYNEGTAGGLFGDIGLDGAINFSIELDTSRNMHIYWNNTEVFTPTGSYVYFSNSWRHVAITYDGTTMKMYTNIGSSYTDELRDSIDITLSHMTKNTTSKFRMGANAPNNGNKYFTGRMKDIRIYKIALTLDEIKGICSVQFDNTNKGVYANSFYELAHNSNFIVTGTLGTLTFTLPITYNTVEDFTVATYKAKGSSYPETVDKTITCKRYIYYTSIYNITTPILLKLSITSPEGTQVDHFGGSYLTGSWTTSGSNHTWSSSTRYWYRHYYLVELEILDNNNNKLGYKMILGVTQSASNATSGSMVTTTTYPIPEVNAAYVEVPFDINDNGNGTKFRIKIIRDCKSDAPVPTETARVCTIEKNTIEAVSLCSIHSNNYLYCTELIENNDIPSITIGNNGSITAKIFSEI